MFTCSQDAMCVRVCACVCDLLACVGERQDIRPTLPLTGGGEGEGREKGWSGRGGVCSYRFVLDFRCGLFYVRRGAVGAVAAGRGASSGVRSEPLQTFL
jgi:hypothetical protein